MMIKLIGDYDYNYQQALKKVVNNIQTHYDLNHQIIQGWLDQENFDQWLEKKDRGCYRKIMSKPHPTLDKLLDPQFYHHLILPSLVLAVYLQGLPLLLMRSNMLEVMQEDFIFMSKMKGLSSWTIVIKHAARNALLPVATAFTLGVGFAFGGNVVIETVFSWPGLGRMLVFAVSSSDYPLAQGTFLFLAAILIFMNFVADILYLFLDPRVSYKTRN